MNHPPFNHKQTVFQTPLAEILREQAKTIRRDNPNEFIPPYEAITDQDWGYLREIIRRIKEIGDANGHTEIKYDVLLTDLATAHCTTTPMNLFGLLCSGNDDFTHDVLGIGRFLDRKNGHLMNGFQPRWTKKS